MLNAEHDEIIPKACTESLWKAFGQPEIIWYNCGHYTAMFFIIDALNRAGDFFAGAVPAATDEAK